MPLSFEDKITPVTTTSTDTSGLSFASKITPVVSPIQSPQVNTPQVSMDSGRASDIPLNIVKEYGSKLMNTYANTPSQIAGDVQAGAEDIQKGNVFYGIAKSGLRTAGDVANTIYAPISNAVGMVFDKLGINDAIAHSELVDKLSNQKWLQDFAVSHPNAEQDFNRALTLAMAGQEKGTIDPKSIISEVKGYVNGVRGGVSNVANEVVNLPSNIKNSATDVAVSSEKNAWSKPTEIPKASYNKATDIYNNAKAQGNDISSNLVNNGIRLSDHVEPNSYGTRVYDTSGTADNLRADAAKTSSEMLRPALKLADSSVEKTPVKDIIDSATERIKEDRTLPSETKDSIIEKLKTTQTSLEKAYPKGMELSDMHDEKITRDINSKYNPLGDVASNMEATKNKALADALRAEVEGKAPKEIPVREFNAELHKQYQTADYLDALHGKTVPQSIMSRVANFAAKVVGAKIGSVTGGGIFGGVAGYHIGGLVEHMVENLPNPVKNYFLNNLEKTNPEAFKSVQSYLKSRETNGSVTNPIKTANMKTNISSSIPLVGEKGKPMKMGTYKLGKNKVTGRVGLTGDYRKPGINFYKKK